MPLIKVLLLSAASATLRDVLKPEDQVWLQERFRMAAHSRYLHLAAACNTSATCPGMCVLML